MKIKWEHYTHTHTQVFNNWLSRKGNTSYFLPFTDFHGVNNASMADLKVSM